MTIKQTTLKLKGPAAIATRRMKRKATQNEIICTTAGYKAGYQKGLTASHRRTVNR